MKNFWIKLAATFFYLGYMPVMPGTFGSLAGLIIFYLIKDYVPIYLTITLFLLLLGLLLTAGAQEIFQKKDPRFIVIDEVTGMLISFIFVPYDVRLLIIGFFIFRILDTLKPFPADRLHNLKGGLGVMGDDIVAGIYTNLLLQILARTASFKIS